jgi:hypothetical protein
MSEYLRATASAAFRIPLFHGLHWPTRRAPRLDPRSLPQHLRRDLGFSDGRASPLRDPLGD